MTGFEWVGLIIGSAFVAVVVGSIVGMIVDMINERRS